MYVLTYFSVPTHCHTLDTIETAREGCALTVPYTMTFAIPVHLY